MVHPMTVPVAVPLTAVAHTDDQSKRKSSNKDKGRPRKKYGPRSSSEKKGR